MDAGNLNELVAFDAPVNVEDAHGAWDTTFAEPEFAYECWANFKYLRGGEVSQGARMEGRQIVVVTVWATPESEAIGINYRMRVLNDARVASVKSPAALTDDRLMLEFTVEFGAPE